MLGGNYDLDDEDQQLALALAQSMEDANAKPKQAAKKAEAKQPAPKAKPNQKGAKPSSLSELSSSSDDEDDEDEELDQDDEKLSELSSSDNEDDEDVLSESSDEEQKQTTRAKAKAKAQPVKVYPKIVGGNKGLQYPEPKLLEKEKPAAKPTAKKAKAKPVAKPAPQRQQQRKQQTVVAKKPAEAKPAEAPVKKTRKQELLDMAFDNVKNILSVVAPDAQYEKLQPAIAAYRDDYVQNSAKLEKLHIADLDKGNDLYSEAITELLIQSYFDLDEAAQARFKAYLNDQIINNDECEQVDKIKKIFDLFEKTAATVALWAQYQPTKKAKPEEIAVEDDNDELSRSLSDDKEEQGSSDNESDKLEDESELSESSSELGDEEPRIQEVVEEPAAKPKTALILELSEADKALSESDKENACRRLMTSVATIFRMLLDEEGKKKVNEYFGEHADKPVAQRLAILRAKDDFAQKFERAKRDNKQLTAAQFIDDLIAERDAPKLKEPVKANKVVQAKPSRSEMTKQAAKAKETATSTTTTTTTKKPAAAVKPVAVNPKEDPIQKVARLKGEIRRMFVWADSEKDEKLHEAQLEAYLGIIEQLNQHTKLDPKVGLDKQTDKLAQQAALARVFKGAHDKNAKLTLKDFLVSEAAVEVGNAAVTPMLATKQQAAKQAGKARQTASVVEPEAKRKRGAKK